MIRAMVILLAATLPLAGTKFKELPPGKGRAETEAACYACHSADLLAQQRLTPKQWTATVDKMIRWGAVVKDEERSVIIDYLSRHYGPANRFVPEKTRPLTR